MLSALTWFAVHALMLLGGAGLVLAFREKR